MLIVPMAFSVSIRSLSLASAAAAASVMLVAHSPGLSHLALLLTADDGQAERQKLNAKFSTGSLAVIEADVTHWADLAPHCGRLVAFVRPRDLLEVG